MGGWLYILASNPGGTLYVGVTNDLVRRVFQHREGAVEGFTKRHQVKMLVYYEQHDTVPLAIQREKNIKHWPREWKIDLDRVAQSEVAGFVSRYLPVISFDGSPGQARR